MLSRLRETLRVSHDLDHSLTLLTQLLGSGLRKLSLRAEELPDFKMNGVQSFGSSPNGLLASPVMTPLAPISNNIRKISIGQNGSLTPARLNTLPRNGASPSPSANSPQSVTTENSPAAWSSAIGYAGTTGKSGRVIERLMSENDKLKRDLNEQMIRAQELERNLQTYKPQIEALRQENDNLSHARGVDSNLISRRDRKIEELKAELAIERQKRESAESLARRRESEKQEMEEQTRRDLNTMTESTKHATLHAEILETSHKQLSAEYRARAETWKKDLGGIIEARDQDHKKLSRLDVVTEQMRQELERSKRLNSEIVQTWERLREEQDTRWRDIVDATQRENERSRLLSQQMDEAVNKMRWVMGLQKMRDGSVANG